VAWVAGLQASPLAALLPGESGRAGRITVGRTLQLDGHPEVYCLGDVARVGNTDHPMLAPVAIQQGRLAASNILRPIEGQAPRPFRYNDRGTMVTIGRSSAVARIYGIPLSGFPAWLVWLTVHLVWLVGFRNRLLVIVNWAWNYLTYDRAVRMIRRRR
jgi:NADH dehydrogenase